MIDQLLNGFYIAFTVQHLFLCFAGVFLGTLVGVLPGLGPMAAISILLPITYKIADPIGSLILMAGIYYGTQYGGSTTSILLNLPGESSSVVTTLDGYQMTRKGRGGAALTIAALSSFLGGTVATFLIMILAKPLSELALLFGPTEYAALMVLGLLASVALVQGSFVKGVGVVLLGILLGLIGIDVNSGMSRFTFEKPELMDGISFGILAMGIFGLGEIFYNIFHQDKTGILTVPTRKDLYPSKDELKEATPAAVRGTIVGSIFGLLPGGGALISSFGSYVIEKRLSKNPEKFGTGTPAGVAAPEAANNAGAQTSFIPMLALGLPITPVMALMIGTLILNGIVPGPQVISSNPELFWGLIASMWIGNLLLVVLNIPLIGIWTSVLRIHWKILYPLIILICIAGAYYIRYNWFDVLLLIPFGLLGYVMRRIDCEPAPLVMGFMVGPMLEEYVIRALSISRGDWTIFLKHPIAVSFLVASIVLVTISILYKIRADNHKR